MKRVFIVLVAVCTISIGVSHAQEMKKGMSLFNAGVGFIDGWGLNASYDYGYGISFLNGGLSFSF